MVTGGFLRDAESGGDIAGRPAACDEAQYLQLPAGQVRDQLASYRWDVMAGGREDSGPCLAVDAGF
jgi:hypothetical protein